MPTSDGGAHSVFICTNRKSKPQCPKSHTHEEESHGEPRPLSFTPAPPPHHVLPPCECSVPPLSPPHLSPICFHPFLVLLCLPLVYMSASPSQCQHHCPGVGEAAVCTQQSGCFCLDCEAGGRDSQRSMGFLDASAKYPPSHSPFSGWHRLWDAQPGNFGLVVREAAEYHHL